MSEARTGKRFKVELPIRINQADSGRGHDGITQDLSAAGVYIRANARFRAGSRVNFVITLPAAVIGADRDVSVQCSGRVVRAEASKGRGKAKRGVACIIDRYKFVRKSRARRAAGC